MPDERERLTMLVMTGTKADEHFLRTEVGMGSRSQYLSGDIWIVLDTSISVTGLN